MKKPFYFIIKDDDTNCHIATLSAKSDRELNLKLQFVLEDHYANKELVIPILEMKDYLIIEGGEGHFSGIEDANGTPVATIFMQQSWLY